jgi:branched-chain amino acid transport system permease protein
MLFLTQVVLGRLLDLHLLVTGLVVIFIVLSMPDGIMGLLRSLSWRRSAAPETVEASR